MRSELLTGTTWNNRNKTGLNLRQIINSTLCTSPTEACYTRQCDNCADRLSSIIIKPTCKGDADDEDNEVRWLNWVCVLGKVSL
ncbi:unnamed protein product [Adineta steineri]|uniref:Uncharacterized protein n=1 Tax=Adineta steineri TaxID=433720 RepID=A0A819RN78_9BILA|nr:unnamed protein product [Adineta steineri]CAF4041053.1 unnamed protein product [Adineta steineri]